MASFDESRNDLSRWRDESERKRQELLLAREAARLRQAERQKFERVARSDGDADRLRELAAAEESARQRVAELDREHTGLLERGAGLWGDFSVFLNPKETLRRLEDRYPILLFPLRLETRFKTDANGRPQLWVRVYPDACLLDSFTPSLTEQEVKNARAFWAAIWRAGGVEEQERAAWRDLAASHGTGRAGWIVREYVPLNPSDKPLRSNESDILLIIMAGEALPPAAADFWRTAWIANGDEAAEQAAFQALELAVGAARAREVVENFRPVNFADTPSPPNTRQSVQVKVAILQLTNAEEMETRRVSWSQAPRVRLLPEQLVLLGYNGKDHEPELEAFSKPILTPLVAGPDPNAPPGKQLEPKDDTLIIPDELAWMFDFEEALKIGMAFRVDLTLAQAKRGFERVIVLGVRFSDSAEQGRLNLETLLEHHLYSRPGLEIIPQGTPTNNTEKGGAGFSFRDDPSKGFKPFLKQEPLYAVEADPLARRDGQWLADTLGIKHDLVQRIPNADGTDQIESRAMNLALWPATLGYMMSTLMQPVFSNADIASTRNFFTRYVSGRGWIPALRIGRQPYGILPVTSFNKINWVNSTRLRINIFGGDPFIYLRHLHGILMKIDADWSDLLEKVGYVGKSGVGVDPHQVLLDVLGLHPTSVEYHPLKANSFTARFNQIALLSFPIALSMLKEFDSEAAMNLLRSFGFPIGANPQLLQLLYRSRQPRLDGPLIDDVPLSESEQIKKTAAGKNYIEWLLDAARTNLQTLQEERGFDNDKKPAAILYLMLRHALQLSLSFVGVREKAKAQGLEVAPALLVEPEVIHVRSAERFSESRYAILHEEMPQRPGLRIADHIVSNISFIDPDLSEQMQGLEHLTQASTARLERALAEHIDCCSYRLDAWKQGFLNWQLEHIRLSGGANEKPGGVFLGAFGWLEHLQPENKVLTPVELPEDMASRINKRGDPPLLRDSTNAGLIHAPSLNHATTAAVLRNGYISNDGRLAVDLSSRRVRLALGILEGMRGGQSLGALLGYQFERFIHDNSPLPIRAFVFALRRKFPLVANQIEKTKSETDSIESIAAMNVVDGLKLINHVQRSNVKTYPFGLSDLPAATNPVHVASIDRALRHIEDVNDAVADLVIAEGVHQAVLGNYDRSAGTLDAFSKGQYPPEPDVVRTPRSGTTLTLRTAIHLNSAPPANPVPIIALTPMATAEPSVNDWLAQRLPLPSDIGCSVTFTDRTTDLEQSVFISQQDLGLHPIDLLYQLEGHSDQSLRFLDDRIIAHLHITQSPKLDAPIRILYTKRVRNKVNWFELQALLNSLRVLVVTSRPLRASDLIRQNDVRAEDQPPNTLDKGRLVTIDGDLRTTRLPAIDALLAALPAAIIDTAITQFVQEVSRLALYRLPQTGVGFAYEWRSQVYDALKDKLKRLTDRWDQRLSRFEQLINDFDTQPGLSEEEKLLKLQEAELLVSTSYIFPTPVGSVAYRIDVGNKGSDFQSKLIDLKNVAQTQFSTLDAFLQNLKGQILDQFDFNNLALDEEEKEIERFRQQLISTLEGLKVEIDKRLTAVEDLLGPIPADPVPVEKLQKAARTLFGEDFQMIPTFTLPAEIGNEMANAWTHSTSGKLTSYLTDASPAGLGFDFPVDDWLHGVARARGKMKHWENVIILSEAFNAKSPQLTPLQLPFMADERWLALEIPPPTQPGARTVQGERLLYTAHFTEDFNKSKPVCGLMVDDWNEVIPEAEETTGVTFHYDRPNSEPPQAWLLALPAVMDGAWSWAELLDAVNDTLNEAKRRAIEPSQIAATAYSWFLPATYSPYTYPEISISNNLLRNRDVYKKT
ncbi:MAG TPA: hypothetical protein VF658_19315 [Pyrinomonadaceae bacterium]|jgi:hypothetical protein